MKRSLSWIVTMAAQLWAALMACIGCGGPQADSQESSAPSVSWKGQDTGYRSTTPAAHDKRPNAVGQQQKP